MTNLRYFTESGRQKWAAWIEALRADSSLPFPKEMLTDSTLTLKAPIPAPLPECIYSTKYELGVALAPVIQALEEARLSADRWPGVWDWLAAFYFESICPQKSNGERKLLKQTCYVFTSLWRRRYRHRIFGPVDLIRRVGPPARLLIHGPPSTLTDWEEQAASRYAIKGNPEVAKALFQLYWDPVEMRPKRGAAPNSNKQGTLRRFSVLLLQLERTYDLLCTDHTGMLDLLPKEFDPFKRST